MHRLFNYAFWVYFKDTGGARKAIDLNKKNERNRERRDCTKASNPYHDCDEYCSERNAGAKPQVGLKQTGFPSLWFSNLSLNFIILFFFFPHQTALLIRLEMTITYLIKMY